MPEPLKRGQALGWTAVAVLSAVVVAFLVWSLQASWRLGGDSDVSIHGWIALGLALVFTLVIGGGLMWLAFYSSRKGYDDAAGKEEE